MSSIWLTTLPARALLLRSLRATLDEAGFVEVETPVRIPAPANEPHILPPPSGRAFLRASGTEPVVRVTVEADDAALVDATLAVLADAVRAAAA